MKEKGSSEAAALPQAPKNFPLRGRDPARPFQRGEPVTAQLHGERHDLTCGALACSPRARSLITPLALGGSGGGVQECDYPPTPTVSICVLLTWACPDATRRTFAPYNA